MSQYIDRKEAARSYRPKAGTMSPGLKRAREPYRVKNAIMGLTLGAFAVGIWAYSISAVKQDVFDDVDEEARAMSATRTPDTTLGVSPGATGSKAVSPANPVVSEEAARAESQSKSQKGLLHYLRFPWS